MDFGLIDLNILDWYSMQYKVLVASFFQKMKSDARKKTVSITWSNILTSLSFKKADFYLLFHVPSNTHCLGSAYFILIYHKDSSIRGI